MTWRQWMAARQLLAEEQIGVHARAGAQIEDVQHKDSLAAVRRS